MISTNYTQTISRRVLKKLLGIAGAFTILAFPFFILHSNTHFEGSQSFCPLKMLTGLPCPGCGITKSLIFIYEGHFLKSLSFHIFGIFIFTSAIVTIIVLSLEIFTQKEYLDKILYSKKFAYVLAGILALYHIVRTILYIYHHSLLEILHESIWM